MGMPISDDGPKPRALVAPTVSLVPTKRSVLDGTASNAVFEVRVIVGATNNAAAADALRSLLDDAFVMGRDETAEVYLAVGTQRVQFVGIGTAKNTAGGVVLASDNAADFLAAMKTLVFDEADSVRKVSVKTINQLAAAGTLDARYLPVVVEGSSYA